MSNQTIHIDFQTIESRNPKYLIVGDLSRWYYAEDLPSFILIKMPGSSKFKSFAFTKNSLNRFNSHNLGITCLSGDCTGENYKGLPDGIYTLCLKSGYEDIEKTAYYLKTDRFDVEIAKRIIQKGLEYSPEDKIFRDHIFQIKWLVEVAKSYAVVGNFSEAQRYFNEAQNLYNSSVCQ